MRRVSRLLLAVLVVCLLRRAKAVASLQTLHEGVRDAIYAHLDPQTWVNVRAASPLLRNDLGDLRRVISRLRSICPGLDAVDTRPESPDFARLFIAQCLLNHNARPFATRPVWLQLAVGASSYQLARMALMAMQAGRNVFYYDIENMLDIKSRITVQCIHGKLTAHTTDIIQPSIVTPTPSSRWRTFLHKLQKKSASSSHDVRSKHVKRILSLDRERQEHDCNRVQDDLENARSWFISFLSKSESYNVDLNELDFYLSYTFDAIDMTVEAIRFRNAKVLSHLLFKHGADPNFGSVNYASPLMWALYRSHVSFDEVSEVGNAKTTHVLLQAGADPNKYCEVSAAFPILMAAKTNQTESLQLLLQYDVDINKTLPSRRNTALHYATRNRNPVMVKALLEHHVDCNVRNVDMQTALHLALENDEEEIVGLLLDYGADPNIPAKRKNSPLIVAAKSASIGIIERLLQHGANPSTPNELNMTPLHYAAMNIRLKVVKLLLKFGADASIVNTIGMNPLHMLAEYEEGTAENEQKELRRILAIVNTFVQAGVDLNAYQRDGYTALMHATVKRKNLVVYALLKMGASISIKSKPHALSLHPEETALQMAKRLNFDDVVVNMRIALVHRRR